MSASKVVSIGEFKGRDTIKVLSEAIDRTRQGEFVGMIFILDTGKGSTKVGATGSYRQSPRTGIAAAQHIVSVLLSQKQHKNNSQGDTNETNIHCCSYCGACWLRYKQ